MEIRILFMLSLLFALLCCGCANNISDSFGHNNDSIETSTENAISTITAEASPEEKFVDLNFIENNTGCPMNGNVSLGGKYSGKTIDGTFRLTYSNFSSFSLENSIDICLKTKINCSMLPVWKTTRCWAVKLDESSFTRQGRQADLITLINASSLHSPKNDYEMTNFIIPGSVSYFIKHQREISVFTNDTYTDIEKLWLYLRGHFQYLYDSETHGLDYWQLPNETLDQQNGDCEDFSNLFTSLAKAYNSSVNCYSLLLPDHVGTFCKIPVQGTISYGFYDNMDTPIRAFASEGQNATGKLNEALTTYFIQYGLDEKNHKILLAFNDETYFNFENNEEFVKWATEL